MIIHVRLFAMMAQDAAASRIDLQVPAGATVDQAAAALRQKFPRMRWPAGTMLAVNQLYVPTVTPEKAAAGAGLGESIELRDGDELAVIPPVSGG